MSSVLSRRRQKQAAFFLVLLCLVWMGHHARRGWQFEHLFDEDQIVYWFRNMPKLLKSNLIRNAGPVYELESAIQTLPQDFSFSFEDKLIAISDWIKQSGTTGLVVMANDKLAFEKYYQGNDASTQVISWSVGKSFVSALIGFALADGSIKSLQDPVNDYVPLLKQGGYKDVSIQDVLEMSSGIDFSEDYADANSGINQLGQAIFFGSSTNEWIAKLRKAKPAGTENHYISVDTQVLGMVLEAATKQKLAAYMEKKLWSRLGPEGDARWLTDAHRTELAFAGLNMRTRDYARFGQLYLDGGRNLNGEQLLPAQWIHDSVTPRTAYLKPGRRMQFGQPALGYAYQFWIPQSDEREFLAIGVYGRFVYVNPARKVVIAKNSAYINYKVDGERMEYESLEAFRAIARQVGGSGTPASRPSGTLLP